MNNGPALVIPQSCDRGEALSEDPIGAHAVLAAIEFTFFFRPMALPLRYFLDKAAERVRRRSTCDRGKLPYFVEGAKSPAVRARYRPNAATDTVPAPRKRKADASARAAHSWRLKTGHEGLERGRGTVRERR